MRKFIILFVALAAMLLAASTAEARGPRGAFRGGFRAGAFNRGFAAGAFGAFGFRSAFSPFGFGAFGFRPSVIVAVQPSAFFGFQTVTLSNGIIVSQPTNASLIVGSEFIVP